MPASATTHTPLMPAARLACRATRATQPPGTIRSDEKLDHPSEPAHLPPVRSPRDRRAHSTFAEDSPPAGAAHTGTGPRFDFSNLPRTSIPHAVLTRPSFLSYHAYGPAGGSTPPNHSTFFPAVAFVCKPPSLR